MFFFIYKKIEVVSIKPLLYKCHLYFLDLVIFDSFYIETLSLVLKWSIAYYFVLFLFCVWKMWIIKSFYCYWVLDIINRVYSWTSIFQTLWKPWNILLVLVMVWCVEVWLYGTRKLSKIPLWQKLFFCFFFFYTYSN